MKQRKASIFRSISDSRRIEYQSARFFLMQQFAHMFYAMAFLLQGSSGKPLDPSEPVPEFGDFHRRFWAGEVDLADKQKKTVYGRVHWERLLQNMRQSTFRRSTRNRFRAEYRRCAPLFGLTDVRRSWLAARLRG